MPSPYRLLQGLRADLDALSSAGLEGSLLYTTDTNQVYVGTGTGTGVPTGWLLVGGAGGSGVTQIVAGTDVIISPVGGTGVVTINATGGGSGPTFVDNETVVGSGTLWTLANMPAAGCVPILFVPPFSGYGLFALELGSIGPYGYTISGVAITTVSSFATGSMRAWYRY